LVTAAAWDWANRNWANRDSEVAALGSFLDSHVFEFAVVEDLATFQAFYEFSIFIAAHNLHTRMLARGFLVYALRGSRRLGGHKSGRVLNTRDGGTECAGISGILAPLRGLSSPFTHIRDEFSVIECGKSSASAWGAFISIRGVFSCKPFSLQ
jgi:hypothetical protein